MCVIRPHICEFRPGVGTGFTQPFTAAQKSGFTASIRADKTAFFFKAATFAKMLTGKTARNRKFYA